MTRQEWENKIIAECNTWPDRQIYPGPNANCEQCVSAYGTDNQDEMLDEGGFSWHACDLCGSTLGGDRHDAHAIDAHGNPVHYDICIDCLMYLAYGDVPATFDDEPVTT